MSNYVTYGMKRIINQEKDVIKKGVSCKCMMETLDCAGIKIYVSSDSDESMPDVNNYENETLEQILACQEFSGTA